MSRISQLLLRKGDIEAQRALNSGAFWGGVASDVSGLPRTIGQFRAQAAKAQQDAEDRQIANDYRTAQTQELRSQSGARAVDAGLKLDERTLAEQTRKVGDWLTSIAGQTDPEQKKAAYASGRAALMADGTLDATDAPEFYPGDSWVKARFTQILPAKERFAALFPEPEKPVVVGPGSQLMGTDGKVLGSTPFKPEEPKAPTVGSFEDYVVQKFGARPTPEQITEARKTYNQADDKNDPLLAEMRQMRIEMMRRQVNSPDLSPAQFRMADSLADDFARDSKDFIQRGQSYGTVLAAAKDPSPAGDLSLIFAYMKMLDPGSVVREGEFATAQNTAGVPDRIRNTYNRLISGERLNPAQRQDFANQAKAVFDASKSRQANIVKTYTQRATVAKLPVEMVVMDYGAGIEPTPPPAPTGGVTVQTPDGQTFTFPSQQQADQFKRRAGLP